MSEVDQRENSISEIKEFLERIFPPLFPGAFVKFWTSLTKEEKDEFRKANLRV